MSKYTRCPNCLKPVFPEDKFCESCGYDLKESVSEPEPAPKAEPAPEPRPAPKAEPVPEPDPVPVREEPEPDIPRYCPNGHNVTDPSYGFCLVCGESLVSAPEKAQKKELVIRTCLNCGYTCEDPDLVYCPSCGISLKDAIRKTVQVPEKPPEVPQPPKPPKPPEPKNWVCTCGMNNDSTDSFCIACGTARFGKTSGSVPGRKSGWTCTCGTANASGVFFCKNCGKPVNMVPGAGSGSGAPAPAEKPAPKDDREIGWVCKCGAWNYGDAVFCSKCRKPRAMAMAGSAPAPFPTGGSGRSTAPARPPVPTSTEKAGKPGLPKGMSMPSADDLAVKKRYGN